MRSFKTSFPDVLADLESISLCMKLDPGVSQFSGFSFNSYFPGEISTFCYNVRTLFLKLIKVGIY